MNDLELTVIVQKGTDTLSNPRLISDKFASCNVVVPNSRGRAWMDLVAAGEELAEKLASVKADDKLRVQCRLDSHRNQKTGQWRLRAFVDDLEILPKEDEAEAA